MSEKHVCTPFCSPVSPATLYQPPRPPASPLPALQAPCQPPKSQTSHAGPQPARGGLPGARSGAKQGKASPRGLTRQQGAGRGMAMAVWAGRGAPPDRPGLGGARGASLQHIAEVCSTKYALHGTNLRAARFMQPPPPPPAAAGLSTDPPRAPPPPPTPAPLPCPTAPLPCCSPAAPR
jgi:hypothetical protein